MKLLAVDCSTDACSVALLLGDACLVEHVVAERQHAGLVLDMAARLLTESGTSLTALDGIAFGQGPGSFTGLRIAAGVTQGLAFGADLAVIGVSSLAALAQHTHEEHGAGHVAAAFDARMGEVYFGLYAFGADGLMSAVGEDTVCAPQDVKLVQAPGAGWTGAGTGWSAHGQVLRERLGATLDAVHADLHPHAGALARLGAVRLQAGEGLPAAGALPVYLRDKVAERPRRLDGSQFEQAGAREHPGTR
ncbi:MAG: tRNA (adenosine(37)-N6)-threonylcarbamoyltransferase complex dimerization subunit type 1 TsaB [Gammaproteobacteria bacterium]